jgi:hypothetical protein
VAIVGKLIAAGMAQHVGIGLDAQIGHDNCPLDQPGEAWRWHHAPIRTQKAMMDFPVGAGGPQASHVRSKDAYGRAILGLTDVQRRRFEHHFSGPEGMPVGQKNHRGIPVTMAVSFGCLDYLIDLIGGQELTGAQFGIRRSCGVTVRFAVVGANRVFSGKASFYSYKTGKTASGPHFDRNLPTAAHRSLPFGTKVRVTDLATSRSVVVVITDRGPWYVIAF